MEKRKLGNSDLNLSVIGLGTWAIGGNGWDYGWGPQSEADSINVIHEAIDCGINWIDTAPIYGLGRAEEVIAKTLLSTNKEVIVATKCGLRSNKLGQVQGNLKGVNILKEFDLSRRRLNREVIDLYQIHWPNPDCDIEEAYETLLNLQLKGHVRWVGVSNFNVSQLERIKTFGKVTSLQPPYNLLDRHLEKEILPWCRANETGVICYSPLQSGLLTGKVTEEWVESLPEDDWRKTKSRFFQQPHLKKNIEYVKKLKEIAQRYNHTVAELAVAWIIAQEGITSAIMGARKKGQIGEVMKAATLNLSEGILKEIESVLGKDLV